MRLVLYHSHQPAAPAPPAIEKVEELTNSFKLSVVKTQAVKTQVKTVCFLGILFDELFIWCQHTDKVKHKCKKDNNKIYCVVYRGNIRGANRTSLLNKYWGLMTAVVD